MGYRLFYELNPDIPSNITLEHNPIITWLDKETHQVLTPIYLWNGEYFEGLSCEQYNQVRAQVINALAHRSIAVARGEAEYLCGPLYPYYEQRVARVA